MNIPPSLAKIAFAVPWLLAAMGGATLFALRFPPSGTFTVHSRVDGKSPWIFPFLPAERTSPPGRQSEGWVGQRITTDPVYFYARVPGPYTTAEVEMEFRPVRQPLFEFGLVHDASAKDVELQPLYASELDSPKWVRATHEGLRGFVRAGAPPSHLASAQPHRIAVWHASSTAPRLMDSGASLTTVDVSLRGSHEFYFVPTDGKLLARFWFHDVNRAFGDDTIRFRVFREDQEISEARFVLRTRNDGRMGSLQRHEVFLPQVEPGVYRISFAASDDIFLRTIETASRRWVVGPRVYFGDTVGYAKTHASGRAWTTSRHLVAETFHAEGLQMLGFGDVSRELKRTHEIYRLDRYDQRAAPAMINAPRGDVRLFLDGFAAFAPDAFFAPKPRTLTDGAMLDEEGIDAVVTPYVPPAHVNDGWLRTTIRVPLPPNAETLRFVLSAPWLTSRAGLVDVRRISITYRRPAERVRDWMQVFRQELSRVRHR